MNLQIAKIEMSNTPPQTPWLFMGLEVLVILGLMAVIFAFAG